MRFVLRKDFHDVKTQNQPKLLLFCHVDPTPKMIHRNNISVPYLDLYLFESGSQTVFLLLILVSLLLLLLPLLVLVERCLAPRKAVFNKKILYPPYSVTHSKPAYAKKYN